MNNMNDMNNNGMNNIGMNPMGENQIGMNNPQNPTNGFNMNNTAQNQNNIIQTYENRIKELEQIIKQKDYEIRTLKQQLNYNMANMNLMNINQMMMNSGNVVQQPIDKGNIIRIGFRSDNNQSYYNYLDFFEGDNASMLRIKFNIKEGILIYKYRCIKEYLTIKENGIENYSMINVTNQIYNVTFKLENITHIIAFSPDCPIDMAIVAYLNDAKKAHDLIEDKVVFIYNHQKLNDKDKTPIKNIFDLDENPKIVVINTNIMIG